MTVVFFGANSSRPEPFLIPFKIYEKVQVTGFALQEFIISGFYIYKSWNMLRPAVDDWSRRARGIMIHLIAVNILIIIMDITLLGTEYADQYQIQTTYKGALYSIKLVMEFSILEQLCAYLKRWNKTQFYSTPTRYHGNAFRAGSDHYCTGSSLQSFGWGSGKHVGVIELERAAHTTNS
jgi:hypothetical protein